jgi:neutral ceramidase
MTKRAFFLLAFTLALPLNAIAQDTKPWQAGVAKTVITPKQYMWMSGYGSRDKPAQGKVHDLWAKALVLQDANGKRCVIVTMDLVGIDRELSDEVCADLMKMHGFEREQIMLSVSHTHCGPVVGRNLISMYSFDDKQHELVKAYTSELHKQLVELVAVAVKSLKPAQVSWSNGHTTFATNRRTNKEADVPKLRELGKLKGPVDHDVPVLCVREPDGKVRAIVFGYACHATVLSFYQWCGDYPTFAQLELEKRHPDATALFFAGCGADQNPLPRRSVELAEGYGKQLAEAVDQVVKAPMTPLTPIVKSTYKKIDLSFGDLPTREKIVQDTMSKNTYIASRAKMLLADIEKTGSLKQAYPYPVQTWRLGDDLTWIALGGEVVVDYSFRLKKELGKVWVTGYANDVMAYIPSLRVLKEGGYEGDTSMIYYGLPTVWGPRVEEAIIAEVHSQAARVRK